MLTTAEEAIPTTGAAERLPGPPREAPRRGSGLRAATRGIPLALGVGMWLGSLGAVRADSLGSYGLLPALPVTWYLAVVVLLAGGTLALLAPRPSAPLLGMYGVALAAAMFATIPLVADVPQYAYVYKHIGVTRYILANGGIDTSVDIYHRWPGFFALAALFAKLSGQGDPITFAAWAEPAFAVANLFGVYTLARRLLGGTRAPWLSAYLFTLTNWIGQNYFAPQALSFTLTLTIYVILVGELASIRPSRATGFILRRAAASGGAAVGALGVRESAPRWPRGGSVTIVVVLYGAVVVSHQLTPYLIILAVASLVALGLVRPRSLVLLLALVAAAYLLPNLSYINDRFGLLSGLNPFSNALNDGTIVEMRKLPGKVLYARAGIVLIFGLWAAAGVAALVRLRRGATRAALIPAAIIVGSGLVFFAQTYGGEGRLRVYLFSLPWCAVLIAPALLPENRPSRAHGATVAAALVGAFALWACAYLIPFDVNHMTKDEVVASEWLYDHGDPTIPIMLADPDFPGLYSPNYADFMRTPAPSYTLLEDPYFRGAALGRAPVIEMAGVVDVMRRYGDSGYLVFSSSQIAYAHSFGLAPDGTLQRLERAVEADDNFRLIFRNPGASIFLFEVEGQ